MLWEAGIVYMAEGFTVETTKSIIQWIIEKNLLPLKLRPKELTLIINSPWRK